MKSTAFKALVAAVSLGFLHTSAGSAIADVSCNVTITRPQSGDREGPDALVMGLATLSPGTFLHVFARRQGLQIWWPQGGGHATLDGNRFRALATLGEDRDKGFPFELVALVLDATENAKIDLWFKRAAETGRYPGMKLPPFAAGCGAPSMITVVRTE